MLLKMHEIVSFFHIVAEFILRKKHKDYIIKSSVFIDGLKQKPKFRTQSQWYQRRLNLLTLFGFFVVWQTLFEKKKEKKIALNL